MIPERMLPHQPRQPTGNWLMRTLRALFLERRLPYAVQIRLEHALALAGMRRKTLRVGPYRVTIRRDTADADFVRNVLVDQEYFRAHRPEPTDTIVDVGANIGTFVLAAAACAPRGRVIAVEPIAENIELLRRNVRQNALAQVEIVAAGIAAASGPGRLYEALPGFHSTVFDRGHGSLEVPMLTLAELFERYRIDVCDFLKFDCEGAEGEFFPTIPSHVWQRILHVAMEFSAPVPGEWIRGALTDEQVRAKHAYGDALIAILEREGFGIDAYFDCVGFRAGYIFAHRIRP